MSEINRLIKQAENAGMLWKRTESSLLAIAKLLNRKVCLTCEGDGIDWDRDKKDYIHCTTCEGRGRV